MLYRETKITEDVEFGLAMHFETSSGQQKLCFFHAVFPIPQFVGSQKRLKLLKNSSVQPQERLAWFWSKAWEQFLEHYHIGPSTKVVIYNKGGGEGKHLAAMFKRIRFRPYIDNCVEIHDLEIWSQFEFPRVDAIVARKKQQKGQFKIIPILRPQKMARKHEAIKRKMRGRQKKMIYDRLNPSPGVLRPNILVEKR